MSQRLDLETVRRKLLLIDDINKLINGSALLHIACEEGDEEVVRLVLSEGADPNNRDCGGDSPLLIACGRGHLKVAKVLVSAGAEVHDSNPKDDTGLSPLHIACWKGFHLIAEYLIRVGADKDERAVYLGLTPLMVACIRNKSLVVSSLLRYEANPNIQNQNYFTALDLAIKEYHMECAEILRNSGKIENTLCYVLRFVSSQIGEVLFGPRYKRAKGVTPT